MLKFGGRKMVLNFGEKFEKIDDFTTVKFFEGKNSIEKSSGTPVTARFSGFLGFVKKPNFTIVKYPFKYT